VTVWELPLSDVRSTTDEWAEHNMLITANDFTVPSIRIVTLQSRLVNYFVVTFSYL